MSFLSPARAYPDRVQERRSGEQDLIGPAVRPRFGSADHAPNRTGGEADAEIDLRQLRHHTKNTLQRILGLINQNPGLRESPEGQQIAQELEYRICLSAKVSDALFGLTKSPASMSDRLRVLSGSLVDLLREESQTIRLGVSVRGDCPVHLRQTVLRVANELIGNAVKHGMRGRPTGRITVRLASDEGTRTTLTVVDNGWGFSGSPTMGEGLEVAQGLAERHDGTLNVWTDEGTVAVLDLPH
ncbi:MAG TPA: ATP-binding protein [Acetobacteraceae bacterium]|nr:ATP-binding protein [Acetobacteraceae bacterium]